MNSRNRMMSFQSALIFVVCLFGNATLGQQVAVVDGTRGAIKTRDTNKANKTVTAKSITGPVAGPTGDNAVSDSTNVSVLPRYLDVGRGTSIDELIRLALRNNGELAAARLEIERARARLNQAGLRPNPTLDFEQTSGRFTGSKGESETSIGISVPLEVNGQRGRRIELARIELEATEAAVAERERRLASDVLLAYTEALALLRELEITEGLSDLDLQTTRLVQVRVNEGESAPIELNLLQVEVERLRSRHALVEGRLQAALLKLKALSGVGLNEPLLLRESLTPTVGLQKTASIDAAIEIALRTRPDLRLARLTEDVAQAGLRLVRAESRPDVTAFARYTVSRSVFDDTPVGALFDKDKLFTYGVSVSLPVFNRNQGAKAEATLAITQAKQRREFLEQLIKNEVISAYTHYQAADKSLQTFEQGVIARAQQNVRTIRVAYELGQFSISELITEQRRLLDSQRDFTEALAERYRALAEIQIALGDIQK